MSTGYGLASPAHSTVSPTLPASTSASAAVAGELLEHDTVAAAAAKTMVIHRYVMA